jgi:hypothetical protein
VEAASEDAEPTEEGHSRPARARRPEHVLSGASFSAAELAAAASTTPELIAEIEEYGLIAGRDIAGIRCYEEDCLVVAKLAASFQAFGVEARHLKAIKHAAERDAALYAQVVMPLLRRRNPTARERAQRELVELGELGASLHDAFVQAELRNLTGG